MAAIILCISTAMACQFGLHYWRAMISRVAAQTISEHLQVAIGNTPAGSYKQDFKAILSLLKMAPGLRGSTNGFKAIRAYYFVIETLGRLVPSMADWSETEMATCSRYVAVLLDRRLQRNVAWAAEIRGM